MSTAYPMDQLFPQVATIASPFRRLAAHLVDWFLFFGPFICTMTVWLYLVDLEESGLPFSAGLRDDVVITMTVLMVIHFLVATAYNFIWLSRDGQTVGKRMLRIRIVRADGEDLSLARILFARTGSTILLGMVPFGGFVDTCMIFSENAQTLHDRAAGTVVVDC